MFQRNSKLLVSLAVCLWVIPTQQCFSQYVNADTVVSYNAGTGFIEGYDNPDAALGESPTDTGAFMGTTYYVTPFNNPYSAADVVSIGTGGHITLRLENYAEKLIDLPEIGVFTYQMFKEDGPWGCNETHDPVQLFRASQQAVVEVSEEGNSWQALNAGLPIAMNIPANAFQDAYATIPADYGKPFTGGLDEFSGKSSLQGVIDVYGGSAGGNWLDFSTVDIEKVGYLRFTVPDDADNSFEFEGLSVASSAIGQPVPEPSMVLLLGFGFGQMLLRKQKVDNT